MPTRKRSELSSSSTSSSKDIASWLRAAKLGHKTRDRIILFIHISAAITVILLIVTLFRKKRGARILLQNLGLINWIPIDSVMAKLNYNGQDLILSLPLRVDYTIALSNTWEDAERKFVSAISPEEGIVIDVGANIGIYSIILAKCHPKLKVIAIEASPDIFARLRSNCELNELSNVTLVNTAISNQDNGITEFYERDSMSTMFKDFLAEFGINDDNLDKRQIQTRTLDSIIENMNLNDISLLKLDIEGAEILALRGASNSLGQKKIRNLLIEYHSRTNLEQLIILMEEYGYKYSIHERPQLFGDEKNINGHMTATLSSNHMPP
jgi:FkbM family methyltransferase